MELNHEKWIQIYGLETFKEGELTEIESNDRLLFEKKMEREGYKRPAVQCFPRKWSNCSYLIGSASTAKSLGVDVELLQNPTNIDFFTGTRPKIPCYAENYGGHQYGAYTNLGDGRTVTIGNIQKQQLQLRGSMRSPYGLKKDGYVPLSTCIYEFFMAEYLNQISIPCCRYLCVMATPVPCSRIKEAPQSCGIATRCAPSWIRFGTLEYFHYRGESTLLKAVVDHLIESFYPECISLEYKETITSQKLITADVYDKNIDSFDESIMKPGKSQEKLGPVTIKLNRYAIFFRRVIEKTAMMVAKWQVYGFVHGLLNTENFSVIGLTIHVSNSSFMDYYDPEWTPNKADTEKRYRFENQPSMTQWALSRLGESIVNLIGESWAAASGDTKPPQDDEPILPSKIQSCSIPASRRIPLGFLFNPSKAENIVRELLTEFEVKFNQYFGEAMCERLGITKYDPKDYDTIINPLLELLASTGADYNTFFRFLCDLSVMDPQNSELCKFGPTGAHSIESLRSKKPSDCLETLLQGLVRLQDADAEFVKSENEKRAIQQLDPIEPLPFSTHEDIANSWKLWLPLYRTRVYSHLPQATRNSPSLLKEEDLKRQERMKKVNPKIVLKSWILSHLTTVVKSNFPPEYESTATKEVNTTENVGIKELHDLQRILIDDAFGERNDTSNDKYFFPPTSVDNINIALVEHIRPSRMDWNKNGVIVGILPAFGDLVYNDTVIASQKSYSKLTSHDQIVAIVNQQYSIVPLQHSGQIKDLSMDETGEYLMVIDSKDMLLISRIGESIREWEQMRYTIAENGIVKQLIGLSQMFDNIAFFTVSKLGKIKLFYYDEMNEIKSLDYQIQLNGETITAASGLTTSEGAILTVAMGNQFSILTFKFDLLEKRLECLSTINVTHQESIKVVSIVCCDESRFVAVTESNLVGHTLQLVQYTGMSWEVTSTLSINQVTCLGPKHPSGNIIGIGYEDGLFEFRHLSNLQVVSLWDEYFPGTFQVHRETESVTMLDDLDSIFDNSKVHVTKTNTDIPIRVCLSPNCFSVARFAICLENSNRCIIRIEKSKSRHLDESEFENLAYRLSVLILLGHRNDCDMEDISFFLKDLMVENNEKMTVLAQTLVKTYKRLINTNSLSSSLFDNTNCKFVVGEIAISMHFLHNAISPLASHTQTLYHILQLGLVKDIFSRALLDPHTLMEQLESALYNYANSEPFLKYNIGSTHHMAAFIMWVLDFSGMLVRFLFIYFKDSTNCDTSPWMYFLIPSIRKNILELLIMVEQFFRIFRPVEGITTHAKHLLYLKRLESVVSENRIVHGQMLLFWKSVCENMDAMSMPNKEGLENDLFAVGSLDVNSLGPILNSLKSLFESSLPSLYHVKSSIYVDAKKEPSTVAAISAFYQPTRFQSNTNIDTILKQNIRENNSKLLQCRRCGQKTQTVMELDEEIQHDFQSMPPWLNAFQDQCFCGGRWLPK